MLRIKPATLTNRDPNTVTMLHIHHGEWFPFVGGCLVVSQACEWDGDTDMQAVADEVNAQKHERISIVAMLN